MWNTMATGVLLIAAMILAHPYGITTMLVWFVSINIGWLFVWHYFVRKLIPLSLWHALKDVVPFAFIAGVTMIATRFITESIGNIYILFGVKIMTAIAIYAILLWISKAAIFKESIEFLRHRKKKNNH